MICQPIPDLKNVFNHCAVFVWHIDKCGNKAIDSQYSVAYMGQSPTGPSDPTYTVDRDAFYNPGGGNTNYEIPIPSQYNGSQSDFDAAVISSGNNYSQDPYDAFNGPNSNTAADNIIEGAGGVAPNVPGAWQQNYGDPSSAGNVGSYWAH